MKWLRRRIAPITVEIDPTELDQWLANPAERDEHQWSDNQENPE